MDKIEDIWEKGNEQVGQDASFNAEAILKSARKSSVGISAKMKKNIWLGIILAAAAFAAFLGNLFFYKGNPPILVLIILCLLASMAVSSYLLKQVRNITKMESSGKNLREILENKISYLNTKFNIALHCISLSIVLVTFTINLSMENSDGIFELRKILILSAFYLFAYIMSFGLMRLTYSVYDKQLRTALWNLEENSYRSLDEVMKRHKRNARIILLVVTILFLSGIAALLYFS